MKKGFYTFGKGLDEVNTQNSTLQAASDWNNIRLDRGRANFDRRHSANINFVWDLNYVQSKPLLVRAIAGGWSLAAIASIRSGQPLNITAGTDNNLDGNNSTDRPDLIGNPFLDPNRPRSQVVDQWFNTAAFSKTTQAANSYDGTAGRNIIDGPGLKTVDMTIARAFRLTEHKSLQFRAEATNAFNFVNLSNPGTNDGECDAPVADGVEVSVLESLAKAQRRQENHKLGLNFCGFAPLRENHMAHN